LDQELLKRYNYQANMASPFRDVKDEDKKEISAIAPRDAIEGMLSAQMIATHDLLMLTLGRSSIEIKNTIDGKYPCTHVAAKLINAFTRQVETFHRLRRGETTDTVVVGQVNIEAGGQAVVGNVKNKLVNKGERHDEK
jgi:hypothetical protein